MAMKFKIGDTVSVNNIFDRPKKSIIIKDGYIDEVKDICYVLNKLTGVWTEKNLLTTRLVLMEKSKYF